MSHFKRSIVTLSSLFVSFALASPFAMAADGGATKAEAEAMVKKAVAFIKANGDKKAYEEFNN